MYRFRGEYLQCPKSKESLEMFSNLPFRPEMKLQKLPIERFFGLKNCSNFNWMKFWKMFMFRTLYMYVDSVSFIKIIIFQTENKKPAKNLWVPMWNGFMCAYFTTNPPPPPFLYKFSSFIEVENCTTFVKGETLIFDSYCFNSTIEKISVIKYTMLCLLRIWGNFFACFKNGFNWLWSISFDKNKSRWLFYLIVIITFSK